MGLSAEILRLGKNGGLVPHKKTVSSLPLGCVMHYPSSGGEYLGWIVSELDSNGCQTAIFNASKGFIDMSVNLRTCEPYSEKFGIGIYYNDELETISLEEIENVKKRLEIDNEKRKQEAAELAKKNDDIRENLIKEYDYLTVLDDYYDMNATKKNLVTLLKREFPKTKFSVRKNGYSSYTIEWTDGAPESRVEELANLFNGYSFDQSGDFFDHDPSIFNRLFGNIKYIHVCRNYSETIENYRSELKDFAIKSGVEGWDAGSVAYRVFNWLFNSLDLTDVVSKNGNLIKNLDIEYPHSDPIGCKMHHLYKIEITDK